MLISKKRFNEEIAKAVHENSEKIYRERELDERFRNLNRDIDERFNWSRADFSDLSRRVYEIEKTLGMHDEHCCDVAVRG